VIVGVANPLPNAAGWNNTDVVVSFSCGGGAAPLVCPPPVTVTTEGQAQVVSGTVTDSAGNTATATMKVSIDKTPPSITVSQNPPPNAAGWNNTDVTVAFSCGDALSGVASCSAPVTVTAEVAGQVLTGMATDRAGNVGTASTHVSIDKTPPTVTLTAPLDGAVRRVSTVDVAGGATDANPITSVSVNGVTVGNAASFATSVALQLGSNSVVASAVDIAGNVGTSPTATVLYQQAPVVKITSPANLAAFGHSPITVSGTIDNPTASVVVGVQKVPATVTGQTFTAADVPLQEGGNVLTAVATDAVGNVGTDSITVVLDTVAPRVLIDSPVAGAVTAASAITVTGRVNDTVLGTINSGQAQVTVNGLPAVVTNRSFEVQGVPLVEGTNTITAAATDAVGNSDTQTITLIRSSVGDLSLNVVTGDQQTGAIGATLPEPLVVVVADATGKPVPGRTVVFRVIENSGVLSAGNGTPSQALISTTGAQGMAQALFTLGSRAGAGNNVVQASLVPAVTDTVLSVPPVVFTASAIAHPAAKINADSGGEQKGVLGQALPRPFVAVVTDDGHNRLLNVPVTFTVLQGGGDISGQTSVTVNSDGDGRAVVVLTLGPQEGVENNTVSATVPNLAGLPAVFKASGYAPGDPTLTRISGVVLDNSNLPIEGVTLRIRGTALSAQSDAQGYFMISAVPVGDEHLVVDGSTAQRPGTWPDLEFELVTVPGINNTLSMPIYLTSLDTQHGIFVDETHGGTLSLSDYPGFSLTVAPNSATFPDGTRRGMISVTAVHADKVPMVPNFGQQPRFIVTIQPPGVRFDPPAKITHPNVDGLPPGTVTELYSFDHDMGSFVATGTATVSADGSMLVSDPGTGILKGGWHCGGNPNTTGAAGDCPMCQSCDGKGCVNNDAMSPPQDGHPPCKAYVCKDGSVTTVNDAFDNPPQNSPHDCKVEVCKDGSVVSIPFDFETPDQASPYDCKQEVCENGQVTEEPNDSETPIENNDPTDCRTYFCQNGDITWKPNDGETPNQPPPQSCTRNICQDGYVVSVPDASLSDACTPPPPQPPGGGGGGGGGGGNGDGGSCSSETVSNPVHLLTGNVFFSQTDLTAGKFLQFSRTYNSQGAYAGAGGIFGPGWTHEFESSLELTSAGAVRLTDARGMSLYFEPQNDGSFVPTQQVFGTAAIRHLADGSYVRAYRTGASDTYDDGGHIVRQEDSLGNATTFERDGSGRLLKVVVPGGRSLTLNYDSAGHVASLQGPDSSTVASYAYDAAGRLSTVAYADGSGYSYAYDAHGQILSVTDAAGVIVESHQYAGNRCVVSERSGGVERYDISYGDTTTVVKDALGRTTTYEWTNVGGWLRVGKVTGPGCSSCGASGDTETWTYDGQGRITTHTDGSGRARSYVYNDQGDPISETDAGGNITRHSYDYDSSGRVRRITSDGPASHRVVDYSAAGPTAITDTLAPGQERTTTITYSALGLTGAITDPSGQTTTFGYSDAGDLTSITDPLSHVVTQRYDARGRKTAVSDPLGHETTFTYDDRDRVVRRTAPDGSHVDLEYDKGGRHLSTTDALGRATLGLFDASGRLQAAVDPLGAATTYRFDAAGNVSALTDTDGHATRFEHDGHNRLSRITYADGSSEQRTYDGAGRLASVEDRRGVSTRYSYDDVGELNQKSYDDGTPTVTYSYDAAGRLTTATNGSDTLTWTYDMAGDILSEVSAANGTTVSRDYDLMARRANVSVNGDLIAAYVYDAASRLTTVTASFGALRFDYDDANRLVALQLPSGVLSSYAYDERDRLTRVEAHTSSSPVVDLGYSYDAAGNRTGKASADVTEEYTYDALDRLVNVSRNDQPAESYSYDPVGNRISSIDDGTYTYDERNRLKTSAGTSYQYDGNGNLVSKADVTGVWAYQWNAENQLVSVAQNGATVATFRYDPLGRRIEKQASGLTTRYVYDGRDIIREVRSDGTVFDYVNGPGIDQALARRSADGSVEYFHADALGSIISVTDDTAAITLTRQYEAYGALQAGAVSGHAFTGREFDAETGLYYYRARYYDPRLGRFISEDPIAIDVRPNLYAYVLDSPVNFTDPLGWDAITDDPAVKKCICDIWTRARGGAERFEFGADITKGQDGKLGCRPWPWAGPGTWQSQKRPSDWPLDDVVAIAHTHPRSSVQRPSLPGEKPPKGDYMNTVPNYVMCNAGLFRAGEGCNSSDAAAKKCTTQPGNSDYCK
jgi:RHS repeat-associated protein